MDDEQTTPGGSWGFGWAPPKVDDPITPARAGNCHCAYCRQGGVCEDFTRHEGRDVHKGECYEKLTKGR